MPYTNSPPDGYTTPPFPSLNVETIHDTTELRLFTLYYIRDVWEFTVIWTFIVYTAFHLTAVFIAMCTHGWRISSWKYLWAVPVVYIGIAAVEALMAGSITGVLLGAVYSAGYYEMNTWIPCVWAFVNLLALLISSFSMQGGL